MNGEQSLYTVGKSITDLCSTNKGPLLIGAALLVAYKAKRVIRFRALRKKWDSAGKDVVVLHAGGPSTGVPHASPFVIKLDTYLKMAGIPFIHDSHKPFGPKGKMPWITLNGQDIGDSQLIMEHLATKFHINFSKKYSSQNLAAGRAIQVMLEEHLLWGIAWWRFVADREYHFLYMCNFPWIASVVLKLGFIRRRVQKILWAQGLGRHDDDVIIEMMMKDIGAVSAYLGEKPFILGDEPCEVDCAVFGFLAIVMWGLEGNPFKPKIMNEFANLNAYSIRMKERFYPDWEQRLWQRKS